MKKAVLWVLAVACSQLVAVGAAAQATKLKFAVFTPDKEQTFVTVMKPFADAVNKEAAGAVDIELFRTARSAARRRSERRWCSTASPTSRG
jgi:TRAP-type C4-dicarboxylate transport system substrate-binding protein